MVVVVVSAAWQYSWHRGEIAPEAISHLGIVCGATCNLYGSLGEKELFLRSQGPTLRKWHSPCLEGNLSQFITTASFLTKKPQNILNFHSVPAIVRGRSCDH